MKTLPMFLPLAATLATFAPSIAALPQASDDDDGVLEASEVALHHYRPHHADARELFSTARQLFLREIAVRSEGQVRPVANMFTLDDAIVVYDTPSYAARVLEQLRELEGVATDQPAYTITEVAPKHIALETALHALRPFERTIEVMNGGRREKTRNMTVIEERSLILLRDTAQNTADMLRTLGSIDQPAPQAMLTYYLLRPTSSESVGLPKDLVANLQALTGTEGFTAVAHGMVRTSVLSRQAISLTSEDGTNRYSLELRPTAYDRQSGAVNFDRISFSMGSMWTGVQSPAGEPAPMREMLRTSTSVRGGEWTVLGSSGSSPYVVLRVAPVE